MTRDKPQSQKRQARCKGPTIGDLKARVTDLRHTLDYLQARLDDEQRRAIRAEVTVKALQDALVVALHRNDRDEEIPF